MALILLVCSAAARAQPQIDVELFDPGFPQGDSNYHCLTAASDGNLYFVVNTHDPKYSAVMFRFNSRDSAMTRLAAMNDLFDPMDDGLTVPHGKVHTPIFEHSGKLYTATHTAYYENGLPRVDADGKHYPGGRLLSYDLATGQFESLAQAPVNEGIIALAMDTVRGRIAGLTWPSGFLLTHDVAKRQVRYYGAVQGRAEWGVHTSEQETVCRSLAVDGEGFFYGSTGAGRIWRLDMTQPRPVTYLDPLNLARVMTAQDTDEAKLASAHLWRAVEWHAPTGMIYGIHALSSTLFAFDPAKRTLRSIAVLRSADELGPPRSPRLSQMGFATGPANTAYHLKHAPPTKLDDREDLSQSVHLLTCDVSTGQVTDRGPLIGPGGRRVYFTESLAIGPDGRLYTVAWVEVADAAQRQRLLEARGTPEAKGTVTDIQLVRLPRL